MNKAYIGGNIMSHASQLEREEECQKIDNANLNLEYYSPARNKSINDKKSVTEEENNHLAEKITIADINRLWDSNYTIMCPEQHAIGTLCEMGCLYGWKYMTDRLLEIDKDTTVTASTETDIIREKAAKYDKLIQIVRDQNSKKNYAHYSDIRTNHLNEKDWRRSFSINQLLYGMILDCTHDKQLHDNFDEILDTLKLNTGGQHD